ncbi:MAG: HD domain-containing protein [Pirellulales bacterium]|nr:HD domain-containing protein [Pirellulales bacterium]
MTSFGITTIANGTSASGTERPLPSTLRHAARALRDAFGIGFQLFDGETGELVVAGDDQPVGDMGLREELCRAVARRGRIEFLQEEPPVMLLAIPIPFEDRGTIVAAAAFVTGELDDVEHQHGVSLLGLTPQETHDWCTRQRPWTAHALERTAHMLLAKLESERRVLRLEREADELSVQIAATYEEISLLYRLIQNLKISAKRDVLARLALEWIAEVLPARGLAIELLPSGETEEAALGANSGPLLLTYGECPVDLEGMRRLIDYLNLGATSVPVVANPPVSEKPDWPHPSIRELVVVPLAEGEKLFGWLAAFNHTSGQQFGTVEANLLNSVGTILGIHSSNIDLYRQQAELLAGVVRALTSAIDAKDPYTCGHSDRVARISVRLAQEMGLDLDTLKTIYLGGLLHDVGKIGIDDNVLRKPGKLTEAEFAHIKTHVEIGYHILIDLKQLSHVLPIVRHHHESWDGRGYPHQLTGENIPFLARIVAVADAFDAMSSDRVYRKGMDEEKLDGILRDGAGKQWDADVIAAFFRARDDVRQIAQSESALSDQRLRGDFS